MSRKHHYIPQLLLKRWATDGGKVTQWKRADYTGVVRKAKKDPEQFGYVFDLYRLLNVADDIALLIESSVFGNEIERQSNLIIEKLIDHKAAVELTQTERAYWTLFLSSFRFRHPSYLKELSDDAALRIDEVCWAHREELEKIWPNTAERNWQDMFASLNPAYLPNLPKKLMLDLIVSKKLCSQLFEMRWVVLHLESANNRLLLGDRPFVELRQSHDLPSFKFLPLSPTKLFISADARDIHLVSRQSPDRIVRTANLETIRRASEFVCGDAERSFLDKHLRPITSSSGGAVTS